MDRGAWRAAVYRTAKSWTWLKLLSTHTCIIIPLLFDKHISFFNLCFLRSLFLNCQDKFDDWIKELSHLSSILQEPCRYTDCRWWSRIVELGAVTHLAPASCLLESALLAGKIGLNCLSTEAVNERHHNLKSSLQLCKFHLKSWLGKDLDIISYTVNVTL